MNIKRYCEQTGRFFSYPSGSDLYQIRYDELRNRHHWTLLINGWREGDFDWDDVRSRIEHLPGIEEYL